jgi:hypothetical protein
MAGAGYKLFASGDVLTASQVNTYLNEQTIMVFSSTSARDTALNSVKSEGMFAYVTGTGLFYYNGSSWLATSLTADITGVTITTASNSGLSGGTSATSGDFSATMTTDLDNLSAGTVTVASDSIAIVDADDSNATKKESIADLVTAITGANLTATSGVIALDIDAEVDFNDQTAKEIVIKDYAETDQALTSATTLAIDLSAGNTGHVTLAHNVTDIDFTNVPANGTSSFTCVFTQDGSGSRTLAINAISVNAGGHVTGKSAGGSGLTLSTGANNIDVVTFLFVDAGTPYINGLLNFS